MVDFVNNLQDFCTAFFSYEFTNLISKCDLLQQNLEQVAWDYFEIKVIEISRAKNWSAVQI